ncbi:plancitoxin-1-like [Ornithodoros turicata]|uniref:plancitoxin-1-like n=1 Tax=Ornithodoros turicata TaxID=34597 RepID=UPI003139E6DD
MSPALLLVVLLLEAASIEASVTCRDQNNNAVDWFIMYKVPRIEFEDGTSTQGTEFAYIDSRTSARKWRISSQSIRSDNPLSYSVAPLFKNDLHSSNTCRVGLHRRLSPYGSSIQAGYVVPGDQGIQFHDLTRQGQRVPENAETERKTKEEEEEEKKKELMYVVYNDQPPPRYTATNDGHSKGLVIFDNTTGVWIQHSIPRFLEVAARQYVFPMNAERNAQTVMCITFPTSAVNTIAWHLRMHHANVYHKSARSALSQKYPEMDRLLQGIYVKYPQPIQSIDTLRSLDGSEFVTVAKRTPWDVDVYSDYVIYHVTSPNLLVQSWLSGAGQKMGPACKESYSVLDTEFINLHMIDKSWKWKSTEDHSKWAVGTSTPWFCFGSLNRMESQKSRGGEVTCMENSVVHKLFRSASETSQHCP